jgi:hypothetical protein
MIIKRNQFFTLLEILIALVLTVVLLTTLTFFYRQVMELNSKTEEIQKESFKRRYAENRLSAIFPQAVSESTKKKDFFFFTVADLGGFFAPGSSASLIFTFNNKVHLSKQFSQHVIGRIYLDPMKRLCLATWPSINQWNGGANLPLHFEVLLEEVESLKFGFFVAHQKKWMLEKDASTPPPVPPPTLPGSPPPPPPPTKVVTVINPSPEGGWLQEWSQDYKQLPAIVRIEVVRKGETEYFAFPLSKCKWQPTYHK